MKAFKFLTILLIIMLLSISFAFTNSKKDLKKEISTIAAHLNKSFLTFRANLKKRAAVIQKAYENQKQYNLSIKGMDVNEGGIYKFFEDKIYYPIKNKFKGKGMIAVILNTNHPMYIAPDIEYKPENFVKARFIKKDGLEFKAIKKEMCLWENIILNVVNAGEDTGYMENIFCANPRNWLCVFNIYFDFLSTVSMDINQKIMGNMYWVMNGTPYGNKNAKPKWLKEAIVSMMGEGWLMSVSMPIYVNGKYRILAATSISIHQFNRKLFKQNKNMLLFLDSKATLLGITPAAKRKLALKELDDFDYLEQMKANPFISRKFSLIHKNQDKAIRTLAEKVLKGENGFELKIRGKVYTIFAKKVPEVGFYVVGLSEK